MAALELRAIAKRYAGADELAVAGVDLTVADGELVVVVGPSGCGKTTLLRMIAGLEEPSAGEIVIDGDDVTHLATQRRDLAMTFQSGALYPNMTVAENLGFPLKVAGVRHDEIARRVREVAELLHVDDVLDRRPRRLSGGQRQRVAMGRSVIRRPRLFLLDEPLANLDSKLRVEMRSSIMRLQRHLGVATMFVTHDQVEAMAMADRLAVMRGGRIAQVGSVADVYADPSDLFVATFVGSPPMGLVHATAVVDGDRGSGLVIGGEWLPWPGLHHRGPVALGLRPEAIRPRVDGPVTGSVVGVDDLGHAQVLHVSLGADRVVVDARGGHRDVDVPAVVPVLAPRDTSPDPWRPLRLSVDRLGAHLFDLVTGAPVGVAPAAVHH